MEGSSCLGIVDIDYNLKDPQGCSLYASDIYDNICVTEVCAAIVTVAVVTIIFHSLIVENAISHSSTHCYYMVSLTLQLLVFFSSLKNIIAADKDLA